MMICIWLTVSFNNLDDLETPLRAVRTPGKGPVCVPMVFLHRFQARHMYLQYAPDKQVQESPRRRTSLGYEPAARSLNIVFNECPKSSWRIKTVSHYPQKSVFQRPTAETRDPHTGETIPGRNGAVWSSPKDSFTVVTSSGKVIEAAGALRLTLQCSEETAGALRLTLQRSDTEETAGALRLTLQRSDTEETAGQFVALFSHPHPHRQFSCYLEPVEEPDLEGEEQHFWSRFLSRRRRTSNDILPQATDRSSLVFASGMSVKAAIRKQGVGPLGTFIPTLTLGVVSDGRALAVMNQLLSIVN